MKPWLNTKQAIENRSKSMKEWWINNRDNPKTLERNNKISKKRSLETKLKMSLAAKGKYKSEEHKKNLSLSKIGKPNLALKNKPKSEEHRKKISVTRKKLFAEGKLISHSKGIPKSKEQKIKQSESMKGKNNPNYRGGIQYEPYDNNWNKNFKNLIRKRDNQVCMNCGKHREQLKYSLDVHHINYNKQLSVKENCISLCHNCHSLTQINRKYWTELFYNKLSKLYGYKYDENKNIIFQFESMKGGIIKNE